ncbi:MAG: hypothetical protein AAFV53_08600 [Myxococcota bacterium]
MGEQLRVATVLWLTLGSSAAFAGPIADDLSAARARIADGDPKGALNQLDQIEDGLPARTTIVPQDEIARIHYLRGAAYFNIPRKRKKGAHTDAWRLALAVDNELPWDRELIEDSDSFRLFEALRGEVRSRGYVDTFVPEATGEARIFVDGVRHRDGEQVIQLGTHLAQIQCPGEQGTFSFFTSFSEDPGWLDRCPGGVDTSIAEEPIDEFGGFGPQFGTPDPIDEPTDEPTDEPNPDPAPDPIAEVGDGPDELPELMAVGSPERQPSAQGGKGFNLGSAMRVSGGVLLVSGAAVNFLVVAPAFSEIEDARADPVSIDREDADTLTARFQVSRAVTLGLIGGGVLMSGAGFFIDAPVRPVVGLQSVGIVGQF